MKEMVLARGCDYDCASSSVSCRVSGQHASPIGNANVNCRLTFLASNPLKSTVGSVMQKQSASGCVHDGCDCESLQTLAERM